MEDHAAFNLEPGCGIVFDSGPGTSKVAPAKSRAAITGSGESTEPWRGIDHCSGREGILPDPLAAIPFEGFRTGSRPVGEALVGVKLADEIGSGGKVASQSSTGQ